MEKDDYALFCKDVEKITNMIDQRRSLKTERKGKARLRDTFVLFKTTWTHAEQWIALPRAIVYWLALTPAAILSFNGAMNFLDAPFKISLEYGSLITMIFIGFVLVFGIFAHSTLGLRRGVNELSIKQNPGWVMAWCMWQEIKEMKELK